MRYKIYEYGVYGGGEVDSTNDKEKALSIARFIDTYNKRDKNGFIVSVFDTQEGIYLHG